MSQSKNIYNSINKLYLEDGLSMAQIAEKLKLSASTVRYRLDKNGIQRRSRSESINKWYLTKFNKKPFKLKSSLSADEINLRTAGIMLYWAEGGKSGNVVKFTNSDPEMVRIFLKFLRIICGIDKDRLKALIHIYPDHDEKKLLSLWVKKTGIPKEHFYKSYLHQGKPGTYKNKSRYGTLAISYPDKRLLEIILKWIDGYREIA